MTEKNTDLVFGTFAKESLPEKIASRILFMIRDRQLRPGDKLPAERELATLIGVSRPPLREALRALALINAVEIRQGDGTYVTGLEPELLVDHLDYVVALNDSTFAHLFEARKAMEVGIAAVAAQRITETEIEAVEVCWLRSQAVLSDYQAFLDADLEFHDLIAKAAHNPIFLSPYMASIRRLGRISRGRMIENPGLPEQSFLDHQVIVAALKAHDGVAAQTAMRQHLDNVEERLFRSATAAYLSQPLRTRLMHSA
jgi:GntR family transcriptional repressor for pyruvate dehydrogenase complex